MPEVAALARAAQAAFEITRARRDIREAEIFVASNGALLTRLNYTSHIPCNGVEEPKSTEAYGLGIQAVFDMPPIYGWLIDRGEPRAIFLVAAGLMALTMLTVLEVGRRGAAVRTAR